MSVQYIGISRCGQEVFDSPHSRNHQQHEGSGGDDPGDVAARIVDIDCIFGEQLVGYYVPGMRRVEVKRGEGGGRALEDIRSSVSESPPVGAVPLYLATLILGDRRSTGGG